MNVIISKIILSIYTFVQDFLLYFFLPFVRKKYLTWWKAK